MKSVTKIIVIDKVVLEILINYETFRVVNDVFSNFVFFAALPTVMLSARLVPRPWWLRVWSPRGNRTQCVRWVWEVGDPEVGWGVVLGSAALRGDAWGSHWAWRWFGAGWGLWVDWGVPSRGHHAVTVVSGGSRMADNRSGDSSPTCSSVQLLEDSTGWFWFFVALHLHDVHYILCCLFLFFDICNFPFIKIRF